MFQDLADDVFGKKFDVVIIGAGVQGLAIAYELGKLGGISVCVLDQSWPGNGASSRNGGMVRSIFSSKEWISLFDYSLTRWHQLSAEFGKNILFDSNGYLVLSSSEKYFEKQKAIHKQHIDRNLKSELMSREDILKLIPSINPDLVVGGILQTNAGHAHHDAVLSAYLRGAQAHGVKLRCGAAVHSIIMENGAAVAVDTPDGKIHAGVIVNAAGAAGQRINDMVGLALPIKPARLEILVTDSMKPFLPCALAAPELLGYCHQTARGEFVGGTERSQLDETTSLNTTFSMLREMARTWVELFPLLAGAHIRRNWAGSVSISPDMAPVIGWAPGIPGLYLNTAWTYGFMGSPGAGSLIAEHIASNVQPELIAPFNPERFAENRLIKEQSLVV